MNTNNGASNHLETVLETTEATDNAMIKLPLILVYYLRYVAVQRYSAVEMLSNYTALLRKFSHVPQNELARHILAGYLRLDNVDALVKRDILVTIAYCEQHAPAPFNIFSFSKKEPLL